MEGKLIEIIDIVMSLKMEHSSTTGRGVASTTGDIPTHHICIGDRNDAISGNGAENSDNSIILSSSLSYWSRTTKRMKDKILQRRVVCVKRKRAPKGSKERDIHHGNATQAPPQTFGAAKHFVPNNSEKESKSTKYTDIQSEYVGNLDIIKLLEARIMVYNMTDPFVILTLVDEYAGAVKYCWGNNAATGVYLLSRQLKVLICVVAQFQRDS